MSAPPVDSLIFFFIRPVSSATSLNDSFSDWKKPNFLYNFPFTFLAAASSGNPDSFGYLVNAPKVANVNLSPPFKCDSEV